MQLLQAGQDEKGKEMREQSTQRFQRALLSLEGLSVGDAFGERFFLRKQVVAKRWTQRKAGIFDSVALTEELGDGPWPWTDDTAMAISIVEVLRDHTKIDEEALAWLFHQRHREERGRGYGPAMHGLLPKLRKQRAWALEPGQLFEGRGSYGNGSAMRVAPVGAYFADDLDTVIEEAHRSSVVTHTHPEATAGAIAIALAAAYAVRAKDQGLPGPKAFLQAIYERTPPSVVFDKIEEAIHLPEETEAPVAARILGSGQEISAQDTVPFVLWVVSRTLPSYEEALWTTVEGLGDIDTTCAMVGGIVVGATGDKEIPALWRTRREELPSFLADEPESRGLDDQRKIR